MTPVQLLRQFLLPALFVGGLFGAYIWRRPAAPPPTAPVVVRAHVELSGRALGTSYTIKLVGDLDATARQAAADRVKAVLATVDAQMSTWREDSELSRFNTSTSTDRFLISPDTWFVLSAANLVHAASDGAFDVTVRPLVDRWGFGPDGRAATEPTDAELAALRATVGQEKLELSLGGDPRATPPDPDAWWVRKRDPAVSADLSAIGKGYAVDRVHDAFVALGHTQLMVEVGGEVRVSGNNPRGQAWGIGIERPDGGARDAQAVVGLTDAAMATSGDYRNFYETGGERRSHTIDPRTGRPIAHHLASVSVVADTCTLADAWATALNVLGPEAGLAKADELGLAAWFLVREGDGLRAEQSRAWAARVEP